MGVRWSRVIQRGDNDDEHVTTLPCRHWQQVLSTPRTKCYQQTATVALCRQQRRTTDDVQTDVGNQWPLMRASKNQRRGVRMVFDNVAATYLRANFS